MIVTLKFAGTELEESVEFPQSVIPNIIEYNGFWYKVYSVMNKDELVLWCVKTEKKHFGVGGENPPVDKDEK